MSVSTVTSTDRTCYSLHTQPAATTGIPTAFPIPRPGRSICTRSPDFQCYKTGQPACCSTDYSCPPFMTMCDNTGAGVTGSNYCGSSAPDFGCWPSTGGRPPCCSEPGGGTINCPTFDDLYEYQPCEPQPRSPTRRVSALFSLFSMRDSFLCHLILLFPPSIAFI